jgi:hypothetical protein
MVAGAESKKVDEQPAVAIARRKDTHSIDVGMFAGDGAVNP